MSETDGRRSTFEGSEIRNTRGPMSEELEPMTPAEAVEWYLAERESDLSEKSHQNQGYRLKRFLEFCSEHEIEEMNSLTGRDLHRYRTWRSKDIQPVTLQGELKPSGYSSNSVRLSRRSSPV